VGTVVNFPDGGEDTLAAWKADQPGTRFADGELHDEIDLFMGPPTRGSWCAERSFQARICAETRACIVTHTNAFAAMHPLLKSDSGKQVRCRTAEDAFAAGRWCPALAGADFT